jgi:hypothetical protein
VSSGVPGSNLGTPAVTVTTEQGRHSSVCSQGRHHVFSALLIFFLNPRTKEG